MNSSSAFSNLLPTAAAQPATQSSPSRKWEADTVKVEFKKALDSARTEQDVKPKERPAKKLATADKEAKTAPDNSNCTARRGPKADKPQVSATEKTEPSNSKQEEKSDTEVAEVVAGTGVEAAVETVAILPNLPLPVEPVAEPLTAESDLVSEVSLELTADTETQAIALEDAGESQLPVAEAVDTTSNPGPLANTAAVSTGAEAETEVIVAGTVAPLKNTAPANASPQLQVETETSSDDGQSAATSDPKALFEKMLQAMTGSTGNNTSGEGAEQGTPPQDKASAAAPVSAAVTSSPLESLARGLEQQSPAARSFVVQTAVPVALGQPSWSHAVGEKVLWLAAQNVQSAEIRLDPPDLGPMQVKVSIQQEQATVSFTSHHAGVREALDQSLGRLRDMFNEQGLNLVNVDVSDRSFQRQQGEGEAQRQGGGSGQQQDDEEEVVAVSSIVQQRLVDHYA